MSNFSCGVAPVTTIGPACSGNGACVFDSTLNRGICICNPGWQGDSDFQVTNDFLDCQINVLGVRILWGVSLAICLLFAYLSASDLKWLWRKHLGIVKKNKSMGKKYGLSDNKGLSALMPYVAIGFPAQVVYSIIKIANQDLKLGASVVVTVFYILWRTTFCMAPDLFQPALLESLLRTERNLDHIIRLNRNLSVAHMIFWISLSILPVIPMVVPQSMFDPQVGIISVAIWFFLIAFCFVFWPIQARYIEHKVQSVLASSYAISKDDRTKRIMEKIALNQHDVIRGAMLQIFVYTFFAVFPFMWNKHDYLVPISFISGTLQIRRALSSLVQEESDKTGSSTKGASSPAVPSDRKQMVIREPNQVSSAGADDSNKEPYIHGLDLEPMTNATVESNYNSSEAEAHDKARSDGPVRVNISPAMRLVRAMTPSRKAAARGEFFQEEAIGDEKTQSNV